MEYRTPRKNRLGERLITEITIPPSPMMQKLGYGTGVAVYRMNRSPGFNKLRSPWALKKVARHNKNAEINERIRCEADILRKLNHPNVVGFRGSIHMRDGSTCLAMEDCTVSLGDVIEHRPDDFPIAPIRRVIQDIAAALNYLHNEALVLHCDVKSYNVLIKGGNFEICKLCDFGVCLPLTKEGFMDFERAGSDTEYIGTMAWCPPEVLGSKQIITTKADVYAYGLVIWEMLALNTPPLPEEQTAEENEVNLVLESRPDLPARDFSPEFNAILEIFYCCTEEDYKRRPTAEDLCAIVYDTK